MIILWDNISISITNEDMKSLMFASEYEAEHSVKCSPERELCQRIREHFVTDFIYFMN